MEQPETDTVLEVLADEYARDILTRTEQEPMSAKELTEVCDASETTIYRRIDQLRSLGFLTETLQIDQQGHHRKLYKTTLEGLAVEVSEGTVSVHVQTEEDVADRFGRLWNDLRPE